MKVNFRIKAIQNLYNDWFFLSKSEQESLGVILLKVDSFPGFPCRISLEDAHVGEEVLLMNYKHQKSN